MLKTIDFQTEREKTSKRTQLFSIFDELQSLGQELPGVVDHHKEKQINEISKLLRKRDDVYVAALLHAINSRIENEN